MSVLVGDFAPSMSSFALCYGRRLISGVRALREGRIIGQILGLGCDAGWDALEGVWYKGAAVPLDSGHITFHPGTLSTGFDDPEQGSDPRFTGGTPTFSGLAWLSVDTTAYPGGDPTDDSTELVVRCRTRRVADYALNDGELEILPDVYTANPALICADLITRVAGLPASRVDWASLLGWRDWCAVEIEVIENGETVTRPRAECHPFWLEGQTLGAMLDWVCIQAFGRWVDDGARIRFQWPGDGREPSYLVRAAEHVLEAPLATCRRAPWRSAPNFVEVGARDPYDETFRQWRTFGERRDAIDAHGVVRGPAMQFPLLPINQVQRLADFAVNQQSDAARFYECSLHSEVSDLVVPGDLLEIDDPGYGLSRAVFEVLEVIQRPPERGGAARLRMREWVQVYSDTPHYQDSAATHPRPDAPTATGGETTVTLNFKVNGNPVEVEVWRQSHRLAVLARPGDGWADPTTWTDGARGACTAAAYRLRAVYADGGRSAFTPPVTVITAGCAAGARPTPQTNPPPTEQP